MDLNSDYEFVLDFEYLKLIKKLSRKGTTLFRMTTTGPSRSYKGQGTAHGLGPGSNHYSLVSSY